MLNEDNANRNVEVESVQSTSSGRGSNWLHFPHIGVKIYLKGQSNIFDNTLIHFPAKSWIRRFGGLGRGGWVTAGLPLSKRSQASCFLLFTVWKLS